MCCGGVSRSTSPSLSWRPTTCSPVWLRPRLPQELRSQRPQELPPVRALCRNQRLQSRPSPRSKLTRTPRVSGKFHKAACKRGLFLLHPALSVRLLVSIAANGFHPGGHHVCREHAGDVMGTSHAEKLDNANLFRIADSVARSPAERAASENHRTAGRART